MSKQTIDKQNLKPNKTMKPSQLNSLPRTIACVAFVALASTPAVHASLSANLNVADNQNLLSLNNAQESLSQLSTGLKISSAADDAQSCLFQQNLLQLNNAQSLYIQTTPLQQSVLQLFGGQQTLSQSGVAQLSQANQSQQSVLQLFNGQSDNSQQSLGQQSLSQLNQAQQNPQNVLQLIGDQSGNQINSAQDNAASLQSQSDNTQQKLSTGLRINQAGQDNNGVPSLNQFLKTGLAKGLQAVNSLQGDPNQILVSSRLTVTACYADQNGQLQILDQASQLAQSQQVLSLLRDGSDNQVVAPADLSSANQLSAGQKLDFFALGDAQDSLAQWMNADGFAQNLADFAAGKGNDQSLSSPYLCFEFQNIWSDGDQLTGSDTILALNVNQVCVNSLLATPEPAMPLTFAACLGVALIAVRKNKKATV